MFSQKRIFSKYSQSGLGISISNKLVLPYLSLNNLKVVRTNLDKGYNIFGQTKAVEGDCICFDVNCGFISKDNLFEIISINNAYNYVSSNDLELTCFNYKGEKIKKIVSLFTFHFACKISKEQFIEAANY